jgi:hypothetical protein
MNPLGLLPLPSTVGPMAPPFAAIDAIFARPRDATAILFLIEDSGYMVPLWQYLRDTYLPSILAAIKGANPSASVGPFSPALPLLPTITPQAEALWMTTSEQVPFKPPSDFWDDIPAINFSSRGGKTISPVNVTHAIEVRQARSSAYALMHDFSLGAVGNLSPWTRNTPPCHYCDPEPLGRRSGSARTSCLVHRGGTNASSA